MANSEIDRDTKDLLDRLKVMEENWNREKTLSARFQAERGAVAADLQLAFAREDELAKTVDRLEQKLKIAEAEIEGLTTRLADQGFTVRRMSADEKALMQKRVKQLEEALNTRTMERDAAEESLRREKTLMQEKISQLTRVRDSLKTEVCNSEGRLDVEKKKVRNLAALLNRTTGERDSAENKLREAERRIVPDLPQEIPHSTTHVLDRASELTRGPRAEEYGPPDVSFGSIAEAWNVYLRASGERAELDGRDVAQMMIMFKSLRDGIKRKADNLVDQAGYAQCAAWVTLPSSDEEDNEDEVMDHLGALDDVALADYVRLRRLGYCHAEAAQEAYLTAQAGAHE